MNADLIKLCEMFLTPATILFGAIGLSRTEPIKALISFLGAALGILWLYRVNAWPGLTYEDWVTATGLAGAFVVASILSAAVHVWRWVLVKPAGARRPLMHR
jgi:hypothetical protein